MYDSFDVADKFCERGDVIDSKIRKFFFKLREKEVERDLRVTVRVVAGEVADDQKIVVELTNDCNPTFLFLLHITKNDFDILRSDQGINVDYKDFPQALVNLLDKCADAFSSNGGVFKLMLEDYCGTAHGSRLIDMKKVKIKILEECAFKNMCHLTLEILRGSEGQIQNKLEMELIKTKQSLLQESKLHDDALKKISELVEDINCRNKEIENLNRVIEELKGQKEEDLRKLCQKSGEQEKQLRDEYEEKMCLEREKFQKRHDSSQTKILALEEEVIKINEKQLEMASQILEKGKEIEIARAELAVTKKEVSVLQNQNSKLDTDYHDKEKAVNILRTRLAVAEQELKDNNILLLNYQKKLDEMSKERVDMQKNLDFIKSKLEKKESVVLNLSEELLKGNEIISKQQAKLSILTAKQKEFEECILEKQKLVEEKENLLISDSKRIASLQEELDKESKQVSDLVDKIKMFEQNLKEKNEKLENAVKVVSIMKENLQNRSSVLKTKSSERSLSFYRTFLSTPCLLPSDDCRRVNVLNNVLKREHQTDDFINSNVTSNCLAVAKNSTEAFIARYIKRFVYIPSSLFRSCNIPLTVITSPNGIAVSQALRNLSFPTCHGDPLCDSKNILRNTNEYLAYTTPDQYLPRRMIPDLSDIDSEPNSNLQSVIACCSSESCDLSAKGRDIHFQKGDSDSNYAPVGAFRLGPAVRNYNYSIERQSRRLMEGPCSKLSLRNTPAISAPPLTRQQKEAKEPVQEDHRLRGRKSKESKSSALTQNLNPFNVCSSNSNENILQKQNPFKVPGKNVMNITAGPNLLNKIKEQPEPSAYFVS